MLTILEHLLISFNFLSSCRSEVSFPHVLALHSTPSTLVFPENVFFLHLPSSFLGIKVPFCRINKLKCLHSFFRKLSISFSLSPKSLSQMEPQGNPLSYLTYPTALKMDVSRSVQCHLKPYLCLDYSRNVSLNSALLPHPLNQIFLNYHSK